MTSIETQSSQPRPLEGIRILDFTTVLAGPYCTYQLALLGAEVTKLERPGKGDWARSGEPMPDIPEFSSQFVAQNANKKSITVDLQTEQGRAIALRLIARADVVVENFSAGVSNRLGIGFAAACEQRADIIYCAISGYGQDGPMAQRPAYDHVIQAMSGITLITGTSETVPNRIGPPMFDYVAGMYGAFAVLAALRERDRTGQPQMLDVSMLDSAIVSMASTVSKLNNAHIEPTPNGNTAASGSPASGIFETQSGLLSMTANQDEQVHRLCHVLEVDALLTDVRFSTSANRLKHADAFRLVLTAALRRRTAAEWEELMSAAHLPVSRVRSVKEVLAEPQVQQREVQRQVHDPVSGNAISVPSIGFKWNQGSVGPSTAPPRLGQHTNETLTELGMNTAEIEALRAAKVI
jgi:crotonobetainyl-CoA:carnitine CoA-transferase CaiB-like acyl-CoA transferase